MGQRAFRGRLTDSLIKNYLTSGNESAPIADYSTSISTTGKSETCYFQGKPVDLNLEFNLDCPLQDILDINSVLTRGLINCAIPKGTKIKNLNLVIKSSFFGEGQTPLHSNLYVLFGCQFYRDISHINIKLYNPSTEKYFNDRKTISNILDFMCFKTIKAVHINGALLFHVIPEYSQFAIVLAYKDINFYEKMDCLSLLQDLFFHPYCTFERKVENFLRCLSAIEKTVPREVNNIILPVVFFNGLSPETFFKRKIIFSDLNQFIKEVGERFKVMSIEFKISFCDCKDEKKLKENYVLFINKIIEENYSVIKEFTYVYMAFNLVREEDINANDQTDKDLMTEFRNILKTKKLSNVALAHHITYTRRNSVTQLDDLYDYYDYVYYDHFYASRIWNTIFTVKTNKLFNVVFRKKNILNNVLKSVFIYEKIYNQGRLNFSTQLVKNKKIVPFEVGANNVMVFTN